MNVVLFTDNSGFPGASKRKAPCRITFAEKDEELVVGDLEAAKELYEKGLGYQEVAKIMGLSEDQLYYFLKRKNLLRSTKENIYFWIPVDDALKMQELLKQAAGEQWAVKLSAILANNLRRLDENV